jgi:hypothetical protein
MYFLTYFKLHRPQPVIRWQAGVNFLSHVWPHVKANNLHLWAAGKSKGSPDKINRFVTGAASPARLRVFALKSYS